MFEFFICVFLAYLVKKRKFKIKKIQIYFGELCLVLNKKKTIMEPSVGIEITTIAINETGGWLESYCKKAS